MGEVLSQSFKIFTTHAHTREIATAPSPLHAIFFTVASSSSTNSVSKLRREAEECEENGPKQRFVSCSKGMWNWKTTVMEINKVRKRITSVLLVEAQGCIQLMCNKKSCC